MTRCYRHYNEFLLERLKSPELALTYLNEAFHDEDQQVFFLALNNVLEAQDKKLVIKKGLKLTDLRSALHVLGFELAIQLAKHK